MSTPQAKQAPKTSPVKAVSTAPKAPRKPKAPALPLAQKFQLMEFVKTADASIPDATLAHMASELVGRVVAQQTISNYRTEFGIANVRKPNSAQLSAYVELLKDQLRAAGIEPAEAPVAAAVEKAQNQAQAA